MWPLAIIMGTPKYFPSVIPSVGSCAFLSEEFYDICKWKRKGTAKLPCDCESCRASRCSLSGYVCNRHLGVRLRPRSMGPEHDVERFSGLVISCSGTSSSFWLHGLTSGAWVFKKHRHDCSVRGDPVVTPNGKYCFCASRAFLFHVLIFLELRGIR